MPFFAGDLCHAYRGVHCDQGVEMSVGLLTFWELVGCEYYVLNQHLNRILRHAELVPASTVPQILGRKVRGTVDPGTSPG